MKLRKIAKLQHHIYKGYYDSPKTKKPPSPPPLLQLNRLIISIIVFSICIYTLVELIINCKDEND